MSTFIEHGGSSTSPTKISRKGDTTKVINEVREKLRAMKKPASLPTNCERIGSVGRRITFMDRNDLYERIWQTFLKEKNYDLSTTDRTDWPLHAIVGTPGSGKTRFMAEVLRQPHPSVAEHFAHYLYIHATYNNGNEVTDLDRKAPARCLALRLLYHYFIEGPPHTRLGSVLGELFKLTKHLDDSVTIHTALELIREDYIQAHRLDHTTTVHIALGLDEYNKFLIGGASASCEIRQIVESLASSRLRPPTNTRVFVLLAGTSRRAIIDAGYHSTLVIDTHRLAPLSEASSLTIIANYFQSTDIYTNASMRHLLLDIGGHPRLLEWLVREMDQHSSVADVNWSAVRHVLTTTIATSWDGTSMAALQSVLMAMVKREPQATDEIQGQSALTIDGLEQRELGLRFDECNVPYWPRLYLQAWTSQLSGHRKQFHSALRYTLDCCTDGEVFTRQHFARFCAQYLALRIAAFDEEHVPVHALLRGAAMAKDVRECNLEVIMPQHESYGGRVLTTNKTFPAKRSLIDAYGVPINWHNTGRVVVNNEGAPFDLFVNLGVPGLKEGFFICGHTQYCNNARLTAEHVMTELKKVKRAMKKAHLKHWMLLIVTIGQCDLSAKEVPARCAVVSASQCQHFFTKPLAERVLFRC